MNLVFESHIFACDSLAPGEVAAHQDPEFVAKFVDQMSRVLVGDRDEFSGDLIFLTFENSSSTRSNFLISTNAILQHALLVSR